MTLFCLSGIRAPAQTPPPPAVAPAPPPAVPAPPRNLFDSPQSSGLLLYDGQLAPGDTRSGVGSPPQPPPAPPPPVGGALPADTFVQPDPSSLLLPPANAPDAGAEGVAGASPAQGARSTFAPYPLRGAAAARLDLISDRGASSFDPTGFGFGRGLSNYRPFSSGVSTTAQRSSGIYLKISAGVAEIVEKVTGIASESEDWRAGTRLAGALDLTLGYPLTGRYLALAYAGSYQVGGRPRSDGSFDQAVTLATHYDLAQLKLLFSGDYSHSTGPDRDLGVSADRDFTSFTFNSYYPISYKSDVNAILNERSTLYSQGISSEEYRASLYFDRMYSAMTRFGLGATGGVLDVDQGDGQTFEQINFRVTYVPTQKLNVSGTVGYEWRQAGDADTSTPVFEGLISYLPQPTTSLSLGVARVVTNSAAVRQTNYTSSSVRGVASQKIGPNVSATLSLGFQNASYQSDGGGDGGREDNLFFVRPDVRYRVRESFDVSLYYSYSDNDSNRRNFQTQEFSLGGNYTF